MSGIQGFPSNQKISLGTGQTNNFVTVVPTDPNRNALDVSRFAFRVGDATVPRTAGANTGLKQLNDFGDQAFFVHDPSTPARRGDIFRAENGNSQQIEIPIINISDDGDYFILSIKDGILPSAGDDFFILRSTTQRVDNTGSQLVVATPGPTQFILDGVPEEVELDTATPANSRPLPVSQLNLDGTVNDPSKKMISFIKDGVEVVVGEDQTTPGNNTPLPVKITSVTGDINITAGDLNVQLSDKGPNPDITRIGDGVNEISVTALGEARVFDDTTHSILTSIGTAVAKESTLDDIKTSIQSIAAEDFATETTLASLENKVLTDAQLRAAPVPVSGPLTDLELRATPVGVDLTNTALPLPTGAATEATLDIVKTAVQSIAAEDFATETTLAALLAKTPAGGLVPEKYDSIDLSYIASGNGAGEIGTVIYELGGVVVAMLTLTYDSLNRLIGVSR